MLWKSPSRLRSEGYTGRRPACETPLAGRFRPVWQTGPRPAHGHVGDCQLSGAAAYSRSRPQAVTRDCSGERTFAMERTDAASEIEIFSPIGGETLHQTGCTY